MEFVMTWREKVTPAGRSYFQLVASARRSSGNGCSGALKNWPGPKSGDAGCGVEPMGDTGRNLVTVAALSHWPAPDHHHHGTPTPEKALAWINSETKRQVNLQDVVALAAWPNPTALSFAESHQPGNNRYTNAVLNLTPWNAPRATDGTNGGPNQTGGALLADAVLTVLPRAGPSARDNKDTPGMATTGTNPDGSTRHRMDQLPRQVHGLISASSVASTEPIGALVLNAAMSRWLMGFPATWDRCSLNWSEWALIARLLSECGGPRPGFWQALAEIASADSGATGTPLSRKRRPCSSGR